MSEVEIVRMKYTWQKILEKYVAISGGVYGVYFVS